MKKTKTKRKSALTAKEFDKKFDDNKEDIIEYLDLSQAKRGDIVPTKRIIVDFPVWMIDQLDSEANRLGIPRQAVIKVFVDLALKSEKTLKKA
ncbi:MAG: CopG family transcriptional regulator [Oligoflexales bacterium]|nr:CopG family transcriptional regulator [Oligoflexales bacterium]